MSEEEKQEQEAPKTEAPQTKTVDFFGVSFDLPTEVADQVIAKRDEKVQSYNQQLEEFNSIKSKEEQARFEAAEAKRKAEALEAAKKGETEEAEKLFAQKYQDQISRYEQFSFRNAVKSELLSRDDILKSAVDDALSQIVTQNQFELDDEFNVKSKDGKSVTEVVAAYVDARDYLKVAKSGQPQGTNKLEPSKAEKQRPTGMAAISAGLAKRLNQ